MKEAIRLFWYNNFSRLFWFHYHNWRYPDLPRIKPGRISREHIRQLEAELKEDIARASVTAPPSGPYQAAAIVCWAAIFGGLYLLWKFL